MTRKDYELIAGVFYYHSGFHTKGTASYINHKAVALSMADALEADNPRFDRVRFLAACGVD